MFSLLHFRDPGHLLKTRSKSPRYEASEPIGAAITDLSCLWSAECVGFPFPDCEHPEDRNGVCAVPRGPQLLARHMAQSRCSGESAILGCIDNEMDAVWAVISVSTEDRFAVFTSRQGWKS